MLEHRAISGILKSTGVQQVSNIGGCCLLVSCALCIVDHQRTKCDGLHVLGSC
jgi:hypothetical protein